MINRIFKFIGIACLILSFSVPVYASENTAGEYYIKVNITQNIVTVFDRNDDAIKTFYCSTGGGTPTGTYYTSDKYDWRFLFGNVYGQYATRITGNILFHSVPYAKRDKGSLKYEEYNKLGSKASMGCIRLTVGDAKWIYDHCKRGTKVILYRSNETIWEKPENPIRINADDLEKRGWDPTDPDIHNPWRKTVRWLDGKRVDVKNMKMYKEGNSFFAEGLVYNGYSYFKKETIHKLLFEAIHEPVIDLSGAGMIVVDGEEYFKLRDCSEIAGYEIVYGAEGIQLKDIVKEEVLESQRMEEILDDKEMEEFADRGNRDTAFE